VDKQFLSISVDKNFVLIIARNLITKLVLRGTSERLELHLLD
jgi:hypothetical protein